MNFSEFLNLVKVVRMLYGIDASRVFFEKNLNSFYKLEIKDLTDKLDVRKLNLSN